MDTQIVEQFEPVQSALGALVREQSERLATGLANDADVLEAVRVAGQLRNLGDSLMVAATEQLDVRSTGPREDRLSTKVGERTTADAIRAITRGGGRTARQFSIAAKIAHREVSITTGERLPGNFPQLTAALHESAIGLEGYLAATTPLHNARARIASEVLAAADEALAGSARGISIGEDGQLQQVPAMDADDLAKLANAWVAYADPDGAAPKEERAMRRRGITLGPERDGSVPIKGFLMPDVAGLFQKQCDAINNPRTKAESGNPEHSSLDLSDDDLAVGSDDGIGGESGGAGSAAGNDSSGNGIDKGIDRAADDGMPADPLPGDERSSAQKMHDAFASILGLAARSAESPRVGGAAPIVTLTMSEEDFLAGRGYASQDSLDAPVAWRAARHAACIGRTQRVVHDVNGQIMHIEITDRVFNAAQRRAIIARDRECVIPGCHTRATWCEIHHVEEHARGGATCTSNGVLLCWYHHRTLGISGWHVRMRDGVPEVRGPRWWDPDQGWHRIRSPLASG